MVVTFLYFDRFIYFRTTLIISEVNTLIAELEAEIIGATPGHPDAEQYQLGGLKLYLRVPEKRFEELLQLTRELSVLPSIFAATTLDIDGPLNSIPKPTTDSTWTVPETGGNWGMEISRVPTMWNLNALVYSGGRNTLTVAAEKGFNSHPDLPVRDLTPVPMGAFSKKDHGNHVLGVIGATYGNGIGVSGANPFASLAFLRQGIFGTDIHFYEFSIVDSPQFTRVVNNSFALHSSYSEEDVNEKGKIALGFMQKLWGPKLSSNPEDWATVKIYITREAVKINFPPPLFVAGAGNDYGVLASRISQYANAALVQIPAYTAQTGINVENNIIVVENIDINKDLFTGGVVDDSGIFYSGSSIGGDISAPGTNIKSTLATGYGSMTGTSMATPHVSGLASYMFSLDPDLTASEVRQLILDNTVNDVSGSAEVDGVTIDVKPRMDAFASVLAIDEFRENRRFLTALLDIDDNTIDGNQRVLIGHSDSPSIADWCTNPADDADNNGIYDELENNKVLKLKTDSDYGQICKDPEGNFLEAYGEPQANEYGPIGDDRIDMSDFRRFRDALLQAEGQTTNLNGSNENSKKDLNLDSAVNVDGSQDAPTENVYPRADFNGDGIISRDVTILFPCQNTDDPRCSAKTDLQVFVEAAKGELWGGALWDDENYTPDDLGNLIDSGDIEVWPHYLFANYPQNNNLNTPSVGCVKSEVVGESQTRTHKRDLERDPHIADYERQVYTLPVGNYTLKAYAYETEDCTGETVFNFERDFEVKLGSDDIWDPAPPVFDTTVKGTLLMENSVIDESKLNSEGYYVIKVPRPSDSGTAAVCEDSHGYSQTYNTSDNVTCLNFITKAKNITVEPLWTLTKDGANFATILVGHETRLDSLPLSLPQEIQSKRLVSVPGEYELDSNLILQRNVMEYNS